MAVTRAKTIVTGCALTASVTLALSCSSEESGPGGASGTSGAGGAGTEMNVNENRPGGAGGAGGASSPAATGGSGGGSSSGEGTGGAGIAGAQGGASSEGSAGTGGGANAGAAGGDAGMPDVPPDDEPDTVADGSMTFFVTSRGGTQGGNLGGLDGADALCRELAVAAGAGFARREWRAYLSTAAVNARDRIGAGPWHNQAGDVIANDLTQLHDQAAGASLDATWPVNDFGVPLDETGAQVAQNVHDILTGSQQNGTVAAGLTCNDWTSSANNVQGQIGHTNRAGLQGQPPSWNAVHAVGCGPAAGNFQQGTVTQGGGRGSIYCFARITGD